MDPRERLDDPQDAIRTAVSGALASTWTAIPGIVTRVNLNPLTVEVQPSIKAIVEDKAGNYTTVALPVLPDVPVLFAAGGNAMLTFPVEVGDECLVVFSSRCIDTWWQQGDVQLPNDSRRHDLSDGFALIGPFSQVRKFANWSAATAQFRSRSGATYVEIDPGDGFANVVTPGNVAVQAGGDAQVTSGGTTTVDATGGCVINAETTINGNVQINGALTVRDGVKAPSYSGLAAGTGTLTVHQAVITTATVNGIVVDAHTHADPQGGNVGPMQ